MIDRCLTERSDTYNKKAGTNIRIFKTKDVRSSKRGGAIKYLNIVTALICLALLHCGIASKMPFVPEDSRVRFDTAVGNWNFETSKRDANITLKKYAEQHLDQGDEKSSISIRRVYDRDYQFDQCKAKGCDTFLLRFIQQDETMYASFHVMLYDEPKSSFEKFFTPDL